MSPLPVTPHRSGARKLLLLLLVPLLATITLGAGGSSADRFGRIGHNMMCVCSCNQVLLDCNHVGCPDSSRMIGELQQQLAGPNGAGADSLILNWFVAKYGATVLAAPIRGGFDTIAWIIPISLFLFATLGTAWLVRHWSQRRQLTASGPAGVGMSGFAPPAHTDDATRNRIRRDTEY